jgi:Domain of unknown function (DUF932)
MTAITTATQMWNNQEALSDAMIRKFAPSVFAKEKFADRSDRYTFISTSDALAALRKEGFVPVRALQSAVHGRRDEADPSKRVGFTKHMITLRSGSKPKVIGGTVGEIILTNSHDGSGAYRLDFGMMRLACLNGLMVKSDKFDSVRVPHFGNIIDMVLEGTTWVAKELPRVQKVAIDWDQRKLTVKQQMEFATRALDISFHSNHPITAEQLLTARRGDDDGATLWKTYNRIQENMIRGGIQGLSSRGTKTNAGAPRQVTTRAITSMPNAINYNRKLWALAEEFAQ